MKSCGKLEYPYRTVKYYLTIASIGFKTRKYRVQPGRVLLTKEKKTHTQTFQYMSFPNRNRKIFIYYSKVEKSYFYNVL